ncbi:Meiotic nuclear division protein 1 [Conglomerata obtusa]
MAKKLKAEEKCQIMLRLFHIKRDFFHLKDIEKYSIKAGITPQTVKETLQTLVDDNLVTQEKLGTSNYYWSFAKDEGRALLEDRDSLNEECASQMKLLKELRDKFESEKDGRENDSERGKLIDGLRAVNDVLDEQRMSMKKYAECDPRVYLEKQEEVKKVKAEINKLTDGIFCMQSYVCDKFGMARTDFNKNFDIDEEMDYVE